MHQLKALIWKAYKVRLRSPFSTALDVGGPIIIIFLYVCLKALTGSYSVQNVENNSPFLLPGGGDSKLLDPKSDLNRHICTKVLFHSSEGSSSSSNSSLATSIGAQCGVELISVANRSDLVDRLRKSLDDRVAFKQENTDLKRSSSTSGCFTLKDSQAPSYQVGIALSNYSYDIFSTESAFNPVINQPYTQGSAFNEIRLPHSDLNSGTHLLELCLARALERSKLVGNGSDISDIKFRIKAFPITASAFIITTLFMVFHLAANFCNAISTVKRISEDNESGLHHYIRSAGVTATVYWLSQLIITFTHLTIQSLVMAVILAAPTNTDLIDPIYETSIAMRWLIILTYSVAINTHAMFVGSLFKSSTHAILAACLLAVGYSMHPLTFMIQWNPYGFSNLGFLPTLVLLNPASNYQAFLEVVFAVYLQTDEPLNFSQLHMTIIGGGMTDWSLGGLWLLLIIQAILWFLATILVDQLFYCSSYSPLGLLFNFFNELFCCTSSAPNSNKQTIESNTSKIGVKSSSVDPNRICCSLRNIGFTGPPFIMARAKTDSLKMSPDMMSRLVPLKDASRTMESSQYLVNRSLRPASASQYRAGSPREQPILLDEALQQNIIWFKTRISYDNLNLDFRYNQISFILGQTNAKDLFFAALLGLRTLDRGNIVLDGANYSAASLNLARSQIGYLGERDVFLNELTIFENLQFFGSLRDSSYTQFDSESLFLLTLLHLSSHRDNLPATLTSRSARKLALAVAAVGHTKLLLLVEPTLSLRWKPRCQVLNLLKKYKAIRSIVVDTSDVDEAVAFGDRIVLLTNGQADLDGKPERLSRKLACGHWLVFEPIGSNAKNISSESVKALEVLTDKIFKHDKLEHLDASTRSVYEQLMKSAYKGSTMSNESKVPTRSKLSGENLHKTTVILKVQQSASSIHGLCLILKMFAHTNYHGFRLVELDYESLEDILVLRMSKGVYPDLPPDLLLSLEHRTQITTNNTEQGPQISVRKASEDIQVPKKENSAFGARFADILKDRLTNGRELLLIIISILVAIVCVAIALGSLQFSMQQDQRLPVTNGATITDAYMQRTGFRVFNSPTIRSNGSSPQSHLNKWTGNKRLAGLVTRTKNESDSVYVASLIQNSKDLVSSIIFYDPQTSETTILFEPQLPHAMIAGIKTSISYHYSKGQTLRSNGRESLYDEDNTKTTNKLLIARNQAEQKTNQQHYFYQSWHEILRGYLNRRLFYGIGFAIAEGVALGVLVIAPIRHRTESRVIKVRTTYWFTMALFDLMLSLVLVMAYTALIIWIERTYSPSLLFCIFFILMLYKLAVLPSIYLVSLVVESSLNGFLFLVLVNVIIGWVFAIHLRTLIDWTVFSDGYLYTIASWIILLNPISSLIDALAIINQINRTDELCDKVPAYTATSNIVDLDSSRKSIIFESWMGKVAECLSNGKSGISTNVLHQGEFGILWDIYLITLIGTILWIFLLFSEKFFGLLARKSNSTRRSTDPLKSVIRSLETSTGHYRWSRERDRLVSEYIRCINEAKYVKQMVKNCIFLRVWLKPLGDQESIDKHVSVILEPLYNLVQAKSEIHVELKTTLQLFIRLGNESSRSKVDKVHLIETYSIFLKKHSDMVTKFAVVDWSRETLYKILLHGHYNTKSTSSVT